MISINVCYCCYDDDEILFLLEKTDFLGKMLGIFRESAFLMVRKSRK